MQSGASSTFRGGERNPPYFKTAKPLSEAALESPSFDEFDDPMSARLN
jgi:hypothetical protein